MQGPGVLHGPGRRLVELVDQHQHRVASQDRRLERRLGLVGELGRLGLVLAVQPHQQGDHDRHEHHDEPGAAAELRDGDDDGDDRRWRAHHRR